MFNLYKCTFECNLGRSETHGAGHPQEPTLLFPSIKAKRAKKFKKSENFGEMFQTNSFVLFEKFLLPWLEF